MLARWIAAPVSQGPDAAAPCPQPTADQRRALLPDSLPGISIETGLLMCNGRLPLYRDMLVKFRDTKRHTADEIRAHLASGNHEAASRTAHSMTTTAGIIGAGELADLARAIVASVAARAPRGSPGRHFLVRAGDAQGRRRPRRPVRARKHGDGGALDADGVRAAGQGLLVRGRRAPLRADLPRQERRGEGSAQGLPDHLLGHRRGRDRQGRPALRLRGGHPQLPAVPGGLPQPDPLRPERPALHPLRRPLDALGGRGRARTATAPRCSTRGPSRSRRWSSPRRCAGAGRTSSRRTARSDPHFFFIAIRPRVRQRHPRGIVDNEVVQGLRRREDLRDGWDRYLRDLIDDLRAPALARRRTATRPGGSSPATRRCSSRPSRSWDGDAPKRFYRTELRNLALVARAYGMQHAPARREAGARQPGLHPQPGGAQALLRLLSPPRAAAPPPPAPPPRAARETGRRSARACARRCP